MTMTIRVEQGDCREVVAQLVAEGVVVDSIVTDPPYDLTAMAKRFGKRDAAPAQHGRDGAMARLSGGFMGLGWDSTGIAFDSQTWRALATILRPGGFLLAFGGTRTAHRMVCAIEDAGFVIQDTIMWLYGSGFPKRRDMLKPAFEPVCVAYKPGGKRTLQVDECRIECGTEHFRGTVAGTCNGALSGIRGSKDFVATDHPGGRWPANICHDGSDEVMEAFAAFGERPTCSPDQIGMGRDGNHTKGIYGARASKITAAYGDVGTAARFFYCAKASGADRAGSKHPTVKPVELIRYLIKLVTPPDGIFLDPFAGSGTAGVAALAENRNAILIEQDAGYVADIRARLAHYSGAGRHSLASRNRNSRPRAALPLLPETAE